MRCFRPSGERRREWVRGFLGRHTCRWIIWQQGQVLHHCRVHVQPSHPPRSKSADPVQLHIRLEDLSLWESCNSSVVCLKSCLETCERTATALPCPPGSGWCSSDAPHAISLGANWHREHQGAPPQTAVAGKMSQSVCQTLWWEWSVLPWECSSSGKRQHSSSAKRYRFDNIYNIIYNSISVVI